MPYIGAGIQKFNTADGLTVNGNAEVTTADNTTQLTLKSTDADASVGPVLDLVRDSGSPADNDLTGSLVFSADDDAGNSTEFVKILTQSQTVANGSEDGRIQMSVMKGGTARNVLDFTNTEVVFNEDSVDLDFRVESNGNANMLFVDGGNDFVGIGTNSPTLDSSLAGLSVSSDSTLLHINDTDGACLKLSDPASGSNRGLGIALQGTSAAISNCESGELRFGTGNTERMRITSAGAIGINESSPSTFLHIDNGGANGSGQADAIRVHNPGTTAGDGAGIKFSAGTSTTGAAIFGIGQAANSCNLVFRAGGDTERMRISSDGRLLHNTTSGTLGGDVVIKATNNNALTIHNARGTSGFFDQIQFSNNAGDTAIGSIKRVNDASVQYNTTSDARLKENIADMTGAIARVKQLAPKRYSWVNEDLDAADQDGFLAHEAQAVVPMAVSGTEDEVEVWQEGEDLPDGVSVGDNKLDSDGNTTPVFMQMDYSRLVPLLTGALQEAITKIETLETEMTALKARVTALEDA